MDQHETETPFFVQFLERVDVDPEMAGTQTPQKQTDDSAKKKDD
ncbi:MAG TPA: hypothetical protein VEK57_00445 [Thermoanaerobaculia bacterium]|nr:hypothetical protein [Thermoanaerobaculia bacterium]